MSISKLNQKDHMNILRSEYQKAEREIFIELKFHDASKQRIFFIILVALNNSQSTIYFGSTTKRLHNKMFLMGLEITINFKFLSNAAYALIAMHIIKHI
jgi:hypothetical protein